MYDLIIIGAGPAGLAASIYASRYKINHLVIGKEVGGAALKAHKVENYPGFESVAGFELMQKFQRHAQSLGAEIKMEEATGLRKTSEGFEVIVRQEEKYSSRSVILALGTELKKTGVPGEERLIGRGVSYCATCDAPFFRQKTVAVVGGSNAAATSAIMLADFADRVYLIFRKDSLEADPVWIKKMEGNPKIKMIARASLGEIKGEDKVESVILKSENEEAKELQANGVFVAIGSIPSVSLAKGLGVETDERGYIKIGPDSSTNVAGVYAAGDATNGSVGWRQIVTAVAEGALASHSAYDYLQKNPAKR